MNEIFLKICILGLLMIVLKLLPLTMGMVWGWDQGNWELREKLGSLPTFILHLSLPGGLPQPTAPHLHLGDPRLQARSGFPAVPAARSLPWACRATSFPFQEQTD